MKIAIYNRGIAFDGTTPFEQPLGGSESGIIYMARALARLGHEVTVYCKIPSPSGGALGEGLEHDNGPRPSFTHYHQFFTDYTSMPWDVVISFRSFDPFLLGRV